MKLTASVLAMTLLLSPLAQARPLGDGEPVGPTSTLPWLVSGGSIGVRWNQTMLSDVGLSIDGSPAGHQSRVDRGNHQWFALDADSALKLEVIRDTVESFPGGGLRFDGGYVLRLRDGSRIDLRGASIRPRAGAAKVFDVVGKDGQAWLELNHPMYDLGVDKRALHMYSSDLRLSKALAERLRVPRAAGQFVGEMTFTTTVQSVGSDQPLDSCDPFPWPGTAVPDVTGQSYQLDLFMQDFPTLDVVGCSLSDQTSHCDGPGGDDGIVAYTLATQLKDNVNNGTIQPTIPGDPLGTSTALYAAAIPWYQMFNPDFSPPDSPQPPYDNDQHAYVLWNLYRFNGDGSLEQIGRSGLKHAYHANTGGNCLDTCNTSHALGRGCEDQYSTGDNDNPVNMGPRSEMVPATGIWGRCGSIWDPECTGNQNPPNPPNDPYGNGNDEWTRRMKTRESQLDPAVNPGATYMIEAWYVARDDIQIYNSMAGQFFTPTWVDGSPGAWLPLNASGFKLGPAIDRWVDPATPPANSLSTELASSEGHAKVGVKVTDLGDGSFRYDYSVMNFDFARAVVVPQENGLDPRVVSDRGFDQFSVPLPSDAVVSATSFRDNANTGDEDWTVAVGSNSVTWSSVSSTLDWFSLFSFSVTTNVAPGSGSSSLHVAQAGSPQAYEVATLVPAAPAPAVTLDTTGVDLDVTTDDTVSTTFTIENTGAADSTLSYSLDSSSTSCTAPVAVPWLTIAPSSGTLANGESDEITVTVDATDLAPDVYAVSLCVTSNDPAQPLVTVPVNVTVEASDVIFANGFDP